MKKAAIIGERYRLETLLAEGGMGEVWRAHDQLLARDVAVKVLRKPLIADPVVAERFRREARSAASLSHPNMANVFDYIETGDQPGIVMELVEGPTLADVIAREAPMPVNRALGLTDQVLAALQAAHAAGVVHRDVKPANVMLAAHDHVKVTDFGIARAIGESTLTETGTVLGSVHYVSPEQLHGGTPQPSSDLYAVGVMLYEMLTAKRPFEAETPVAVAMSRLQNDPSPPRIHRPDLPAPLNDVVLKALAREPADRYESADAMRSALDEAGRRAQELIATGRMPAADPSPTLVMPLAVDADATTRFATRKTEAASKVQRPRERVRRTRRAILGIAIGFVVLGLMALFSSRPPEMVKVPNFVGQRMENAEAIAAGRKLELEVVTEKVSRSDKGVVLAQKTAPNAMVEAGSTIALTVSSGPPACCTVPSLTGKTRSEAERALKAAGLEQGAITFKVSTEDPGTVIGQSADAGAFLSPGTKVDMVIATAPEEHKGKGKGRSD